MNTVTTEPATDVAVTVGPLGQEDLPAADHVFRLAFGTMLGLPEPHRFAEGAEIVRSRWLADPAAAFKAEAGGELVGSAFVTRWGSFAIFGPLTVRPDFWDHGVGTRLWEARLPLLDRWGITHAGLFTAPHSTKHVHLYQKFGFWPRFLTALMAKEVGPSRGLAPTLASALSDAGREEVIAESRALTDAIYPGLDLEREIRVVTDQHVGDVVLSHSGGALTGFAVCHGGAGSEAGPGTCYVKFAAAKPGHRAQERLDELVGACESFAAERGLARLEAGVNVARHDAYRQLAARGYRTFRQGVAMERPNDAGFNRPDVFVLDDWR
jgi:GNAT superfamily N-acetyltransferase